MPHVCQQQRQTSASALPQQHPYLRVPCSDYLAQSTFSLSGTQRTRKKNKITGKIITFIIFTSNFSIFCTMNKAADRFLEMKKATCNTVSKLSDSLLIKYFLSLQTLFLNNYIKNKIITKYNIAHQSYFSTVSYSKQT